MANNAGKEKRDERTRAIRPNDFTPLRTSTRSFSISFFLFAFFLFFFCFLFRRFPFAARVSLDRWIARDTNSVRAGGHAIRRGGEEIPLVTRRTIAGVRCKGEREREKEEKKKPSWSKTRFRTMTALYSA